MSNFSLVSRDFQNFFFSKFDCLFISKKILFSPSLYTAIMFEKSFPYYSWLQVYIFLFFRPESYIQRFGSSVAKEWLHLRPATENQGRHLHVLRSNRYLRYILPLLREITLIWIYMTCFSFCAVLCVKLHLARKIFLNLIYLF